MMTEVHQYQSNFHKIIRHVTEMRRCTNSKVMPTEISFSFRFKLISFSGDRSPVLTRPAQRSDFKYKGDNKSSQHSVPAKGLVVVCLA